MQNMKIELGIERYEHLKDKSCYNHNYYKLESYGDWCYLPYSILLEECHEDENYFTFSLGKFNEKVEFFVYWNGIQITDVMESKTFL